MATLPSPAPAQGSTAWYPDYTAIRTQGDAQEATITNHEGRIATLESAPTTQLVGVVQVDSFSGANDDAKLDAALSYAQQQTRIPYIQFSARVFNWNKPNRTPFSGMKLIGPNSPGPKNLQIANGSPVNHKISVGAGIGNGASAMFNGGNLQLYSVYVGNLAFQGNWSGQFWDQPGGTLYASEFNSLTFYGLSSVFGNSSSKALITQVCFTGHWYCNAGSGQTLFNLGGSDNELWMGHYCNLDSGSAAGGGQGSFQVVLDSISKTNVGRIYCTAEQGWRGIKVSGNGAGLNFFGTSFEGHLNSAPCHGATLRWEGSAGAVFGGWFAYGMTAPTTLGGDNNGMIDVRGGNLLIDRPYYTRANGVAESVPLIYAAGGSTRVVAREVAALGTWTGKPVIQVVSGATVVADSTFTLA